MLKWIGESAKAVAAGVIAGYGSFTAYQGVDTAGGANLTGMEWANIVAFIFVTALGVWLVPNAPKDILPKE